MFRLLSDLYAALGSKGMCSGCVVAVCLFRHAMRSAVFCIVSFVMFIVDAIGDHRMEAYPSIGLVMVCMLTPRVSYLEHLPSICKVSSCYQCVCCQ